MDMEKGSVSGAGLMDEFLQILLLATEARNWEMSDKKGELVPSARNRKLDREREIPFNPEIMWRAW